MNKDKKTEGPNKPRKAVYVRLKDEVYEWLEDERKARGGDEAGVKMPQVLRGKLKQQMDSERKRKK